MWLDQYARLCRDDRFGPSVATIPECRGGFDFTVTFEESIFSIGPACIVLLFFPWRMSFLWDRSRKTSKSWRFGVKLAGFVALGVLQAVLLGVISMEHVAYRTLFLASVTVQLGAIILLALLSSWEHSRTVRPSFLIATFLITTCILDAARAHTQYLIPGGSPIPVLLIANVVVKLLLLMVEAMDKTSVLLDEHSQLSAEMRSGVLSRALFLWLIPLLWRGFRSVIEPSKLPAIYEGLSSEALTTRVETRWKRGRDGSLLVQVLASFPKELVIIFVSSTIQVALHICQPFLIEKTVTFLDSPTAPINIGYGLLGGFFFVSVGNALVTPWCFHYLFRLTVMVRGALVSMIYSKLLQTTVNSTDQSTAFTLMTTDVENIVETLWRLVLEPWSCLLQIGIGTYLLYLQVGAICCVPILSILATFVVVGLAAAKLGDHQGAWFQAVENRIKLTSQSLGSLHSVKLLGLSRHMEEAISTKRKDELRVSQKFRFVNCVAMTTSFLPVYLSPLITFGAFAIMKMVSHDAPMPVSTAVATLSILNLITTPARQLLFTVAVGLQSIGSFARIQAFLNLGRYPKAGISDGPQEASHFLDQGGEEEEDHQIQLRQMWPTDTTLVDTPPADDFETYFSVGTVTAVTGPIGCGKSTFLRSLLPKESDSMLPLHAIDISYCGQTPWIHHGTIRDNIVGQSDWDAVRYGEVLRACALSADLKAMPDDDSTIVGSMGLSLSGGQRQRIAIARALFANKKRCIFDDVTSALDAHTSHAVTEAVFGRDGLLRACGNGTVVATHSQQILHLADRIILLGRDAKVVDSGSYEELSARHSLGHGQATEPVSTLSTTAPKDEQERPATAGADLVAFRAELDTKIQDMRRQKGDWKSYSFYIGTMGYPHFSVFVLGTAACVALSALFQVWITWWAQDTSGKRSLGFWLGLYAVWAVLSMVGLLAIAQFFMGTLASKASTAIHAKLLTAAMRAPMVVISKMEIGSLINRFSQDIRLIDWQLPFTIILALLGKYWTCPHIGVAIAAVPFIAVSLPVLVGILFLLQLFYLRTSRQLRLLEIEMKAPIVSLFLDTIQGLTTIRAFGWSQAYIRKSLSLLDTSQKPIYLLFCIQRWLLLVLSLTVAALQILAVGIAIATKSNSNAGLVGLAIIQIATLTEALSMLIIQWTEVETTLGAVTRIFQFTQDMPRDDQRRGTEKGVVTDSTFAATGSIVFEDISATYDSNAGGNMVLKNISLSIEPGENIGICGRTGSGKSSLVSALLRLLPCQQGRILIGGVDIATMDPEAVRTKLNVVTQEPFLIEGTVRDNLNPWKSTVSDEAMMGALSKVELSEKITSLGGLDSPLEDKSLSHGQRQLFCLARALLRESSILILDEPTGHVDPTTDATMQRVIRECFQEQTIIMIAHRLKGLLDFDRVAVLDSGRLVEVGAPKDLLSDAASAFRSLYQRVSNEEQ
ncbi:P-loop containing nucleoside triphosphate hydrolase protein [Apiospora aurea]|uniref:P-loop containing nucleoside triphosphate hydrolase protein n=1 Tax=Apiospora aurea TaxID=335848 RepID=A0ABR1QWD3_9PEZI